MKKRYLLIGLLLLLVIPALSLSQQFWYPPDKATVGLIDPNTYPDNTVVEYVWYIRYSDNVETEVARTTEKSYTYTIAQNSTAMVGAAIELRDTLSGNLISESTIAWSDDPNACEGGLPFGLFLLNIVRPLLVKE